MVRILSHRGPDDAAVWSDGAVGMGRCVKRLTPQSMHQESVLPGSAAGFLVLAADVRLDNRRELIHQLDLTHHPAGEVSDGQLVLAAYKKWNLDCAKRLVGAFSFVLWDGQARHFFCARDHLGLHPFYYAQSKRAFAFASEIKALLTLPWVPRRLNETRIADYLMHVTDDKEATFYERVLRLPPAHVMIVTPDGHVHRKQYWKVDPNRRVAARSDAEYAAGYRNRFVEAVRCRLRSTRPVGSLLSGGLDSSAVTCVGRALQKEDGVKRSLDTFSVIYEELPQCDERPYIRSVLEEGETRPHFVVGDQLNLLGDLDRMLWYADEPFFTPNLFLHWHLWQAGRASRIGVMLDGFLGDNVVSHGDRYLTELAAAGRWLSLAREVHTTAGMIGSSRWQAYRYLLKQYVFKPLVSEPLWERWAGQRSPLTSPHARFVCTDLLRRVEWEEHARRLGVTAAQRTPRSVRAGHHAELTAGLLPGSLETVNKTAAAFGIAPRFPFADRRLIEYCLATPPTQKYHRGWTRMIARRAMKGYLPEKVRMRYGKTQIHANFRRSLLVLGEKELRTLIFDRLPAVARPYVNVEALQGTGRRALQSHRGPHPERRPPDDAVLSLWLAAVLTKWLEREQEYGRSGKRDVKNDEDDFPALETDDRGSSARAAAGF